MSTRGVTQRELFAKSDRRIVKEIVSEHVKIIDASITAAHSAGFNHVEYDLPNNFGINNLDKADAQTMIYSEILMTYKNAEKDGGKGFEDVRIIIGKSHKIHIGWLNGMDDTERAARKAFILGCIAKTARP